MTFLDEQPLGRAWSEHEIVDDHREKLGKVTDVIYDYSAEPRPRWATIKMHAWGREHLAPLSGARMADDGRIVLACNRQSVKSAPKPPRDHVLTRDLEADLASHYHLPSSG